MLILIQLLDGTHYIGWPIAFPTCAWLCWEKTWVNFKPPIWKCWLRPYIKVVTHNYLTLINIAYFVIKYVSVILHHLDIHIFTITVLILGPFSTSITKVLFFNYCVALAKGDFDKFVKFESNHWSCMCLNSCLKYACAALFLIFIYKHFCL